MFIQPTHAQKMQRAEAQKRFMKRVKAYGHDRQGRFNVGRFHEAMHWYSTGWPDEWKEVAQYHNTMKHAGFNRHGNVVKHHAPPQR